MMQKSMLFSSCYTLLSSTQKTRLLKLIVELMQYFTCLVSSLAFFELEQDKSPQCSM